MARKQRGKKSKLQKFLDFICCASLCRSKATHTHDGDIQTDDEDGDDIIVTRVYVSASADNIVRHHKNFTSRCDSDTDVKSFVARKIEEKSNQKSIHDTRMQTTPGMVDRTDQSQDIINAIAVHPDAEYDMFADGELFPEDWPENHLVNESGDIGEWEMYIE